MQPTIHPKVFLVLGFLCACRGVTSEPVQPLTPPEIITQPESVAVIVGQTAAFSVTAVGSAPLSYQWRRGTTRIPDATSSTYTTPAVTLGDDGAVFSVIVANSTGEVASRDVVLTVTANPTAPTISSQPESTAVAVGQMATFSVTASGTAPLVYQWRRGMTSIPGATESTYTTPAATLADNGAVFSVIVANGVGQATSADAVLTVRAEQTLPTIAQYTASPATITRGETSTLSWSVADATNVSLSEGIGVVSGSSTTVSPNQTTAYTLTATNAGGSRTARVTVFVNAPGEPPAPTQPMYSDHPRLFMRPNQVASFREACKNGYKNAEYRDLKAYVDYCMGPAGWRSGWISANLASATIVALVEQTQTYQEEAWRRAKYFIDNADPRYDDFGQIAGLSLSALAMYYDLLWDVNAAHRQEVATWFRNAYLVEFSQFGNPHGGSDHPPIGNHYLDSIMRSEWFALTCKGDHYYDEDADAAYEHLLRRWVGDGDMKSAMRLIGGENGGMYEGAYYYVLTWQPVLSVLLAAFQTSHPDVSDDWIRYHYALVHNAAQIMMHAKRPWDGVLDPSGDSYDPWHVVILFSTSLAQKWGGPMGRAVVADAGCTLDDLYQWPRPDVPGDSYRNGALAYRTLYRQDVPNPDYSTIETAMNTTVEGGMVSYMRSAWNDPAATWASFEATDRLGGHRQAAQGHFQIGKHATLASKSGSYSVFEGDHEYNYQKRTYAHNCMTVYLPGQIFHIVGRDFASDGGQFWPGTFWCGTYGECIEHPHDLSRDIRYQNDDAYTYSHADLTGAYNDNPAAWGPYLTPDRLRSYTRQFVYFRPDYFVVVDRMVSTDPSYEKKWILHTPNEPVINGSELHADNGHGRLFCRTLLPTSVHVQKVGGPNLEDAYTSNYGSLAWPPTPSHGRTEGFESRTWRIEVTPSSSATNDLFVHVLQATETTTGAMIANRRLATVDAGHEGVQLMTNENPRVLVFSKDDNRDTQAEFTIAQSAWTGIAGILVSDLSPGQYTVSRNGATLLTTHADENGVIYFEDSVFGSYQVSRTGS